MLLSCNRNNNTTWMLCRQMCLQVVKQSLDPTADGFLSNGSSWTRVVLSFNEYCNTKNGLYLTNTGYRCRTINISFHWKTQKLENHSAAFLFSPRWCSGNQAKFSGLIYSFRKIWESLEKYVFECSIAVWQNKNAKEGCVVFVPVWFFALSRNI